MTDPLVVPLFMFALALVHATLLLSWRDRIHAGVERRPSSDLPDRVTVTVVVPARNAADTLAALLQDIHAQDLSKQVMEVIVVDDHSEDGTVALVQGMMRTWPRLKCLRNKGTGKKVAITTAVEHAQGDIILLTDADARCGRERVSSIIRHMANEGPDLLVLPVRTTGERGFLGRLQEEEQAGLLGMAAGEALLGRPSLANGANLAFTRSSFAAVGGYAGDRFASGDDVFLVQRMRRAGKRIDYLLDARALVTVRSEPSWSGFLRQRLRWAGKMRGVRGAMWSGLLGLGTPWLLCFATWNYRPASVISEHGLEGMAMLLLAWLLWCIPVVVLVGEVKRFLHQRHHPLTALFSYLLFVVYAPVIAVLSMFVKPSWKGRRL